MNITQQLKESLERRTNLVQIRVSDTEKSQIDYICERLDIRINKLGYEFLRFGFEQFLKENPELKQEFESQIQ